MTQHATPVSVGEADATLAAAIGTTPCFASSSIQSCCLLREESEQRRAHSFVVHVDVVDDENIAGNDNVVRLGSLRASNQSNDNVQVYQVKHRFPEISHSIFQTARVSYCPNSSQNRNASDVILISTVRASPVVFLYLMFCTSKLNDSNKDHIISHTLVKVDTGPCELLFQREVVSEVKKRNFIEFLQTFQSQSL